ncbi:MAG: ABC transporter permease [Xanthobacteraceae bacterium]|nr:ABC transporter permease [Xanthobacteraceae bacterium]
MSHADTAAAPSRLTLSDNVINVSYRLLAVAIICVILSFVSDAFLTTNNLLNVLRQASLVFFMASGLTLVILTGNIDLSIGATVGLSACVAATVIKSTGSPWVGAAVAVGIGALVGLANGMMVTRLRIPSFIATYGMLWVAQGATYYYMGGQSVYGFPEGFRALGSGHLFGVPIPIYLMLVLLLIGNAFLNRTVYGQQIYAIGANAVAARLSGVPVRRRLILVFVASGAMAGLASLIYLARLNSAEGDIGETLTLPTIAAVVIGGTSLFGGVGSLFGTLIGGLILTLILNGMNLMSVNANWQPLVTGLIVILAVWLDMKMRSRANAGH